MSCHKAIVVITGRAHCFHDYKYILCPSCFCEIWALCVLWITSDHLYKYIYIYILYKYKIYTYIIYIYIYIYIYVHIHIYIYIYNIYIYIYIYTHTHTHTHKHEISLRYHNWAALEWLELDEKGAAWKSLCPRCSKCLQASLELGFFVFFLWLFDLRLIAVSAFSTYWILHNMHSVRSIMHSLLKLRLKKILNVRFVCWFVNVVVVITWLQYRCCHYPYYSGNGIEPLHPFGTLV